MENLNWEWVRCRIETILFDPFPLNTMQLVVVMKAGSDEAIAL